MSKRILLVLPLESQPALDDSVLRVRDVNDASGFASITSKQGDFDEIKVSCGTPVTNADVLSSKHIFNPSSAELTPALLSLFS